MSVSVIYVQLLNKQDNYIYILIELFNIMFFQLVNDTLSHLYLD